MRGTPRTIRSRSSRAFTLVELMVAVAIIGLLASISIPGYTLVMARVRRADLVQNRELLIREIRQVFRSGVPFPTDFMGVPNPPWDWSMTSPTRPGQQGEFRWDLEPYKFIAQQGAGAISTTKVRFITYMWSSPPYSYAWVFGYHDFDGDGVLGSTYTTLMSDNALGRPGNDLVRYDSETWMTPSQIFE